MAPGGYHGRALVIDAATGAGEALELPEQVLRDYLGGVGLGTWLLRRLPPRDGDPLAGGAPPASAGAPAA